MSKTPCTAGLQKSRQRVQVPTTFISQKIFNFAAGEKAEGSFQVTNSTFFSNLFNNEGEPRGGWAFKINGVATSATIDWNNDTYSCWYRGNGSESAGDPIGTIKLNRSTQEVSFSFYPMGSQTWTENVTIEFTKWGNGNIVYNF